MAKGLRSKSKRRYRTLRRESVVQAPWQAEAENNRQEVMQAVLAAPRPFEQKDGGQGGGDGGPAGMDVVQHGDAAMAVDGQAEGTSGNPGKLLKKLRKQRLAATKGIIKGQAKRNNPLAGANQFHKKKKKKH